jgi:hypothetical protein
VYAIQNIKTGKFVYGTDYRYYPRRQRTSFEKMLTYDELFFAENDFLCRCCGKDYRIVELEPVKVKCVLPVVKDTRRDR